MDPAAALPRSPELLSPQDSALLVIDVQTKLLTLIPEQRRIVWNIRRLIDGARLMGTAVHATEQYPQGLGGTAPELAQLLPDRAAKQEFSCGCLGDLCEGFAAAGRHKLLLAGIETHVCVLQTACDLLHAGYRVYLAVDAVGARRAIDHETALRRLDSAGATLTTTESVLFEWCQTSAHPRFKEVSKLVREAEPA